MEGIEDDNFQISQTKQKGISLRIFNTHLRPTQEKI